MAGTLGGRREARQRRSATEILVELCIRPRRGLAAWSAPCPQCSAARRKKKAECLSVSIDQVGILWNCHHCDWSGRRYFDDGRRRDGDGDRRVEHRGVEHREHDNGRRALAIWGESAPLAGSPGLAYLRARKITELPPGIEHSLRFHPRCPFNGAFRPCVVGLFRDVITNEPKAIHRIAIDGGGKWSLGPKSGCAVKLSPDDAVEQGLAIGEGVETMLAAWQFGFRPAWACGDAGNLADFPVLAGIGEVIIIADNDPPDERGHRKGPEAALECSARWTAAGRAATRVVPTRIGADFNDIWKAR